EVIPVADEDVARRKARAGDGGDLQVVDEPLDGAAGLVDDDVAPRETDRAHGQSSRLLRAAGLLCRRRGLAAGEGGGVIRVVVAAHVAGRARSVNARRGRVISRAAERAEIIQ